MQFSSSNSRRTVNFAALTGVAAGVFRVSDQDPPLVEPAALRHSEIRTTAGGQQQFLERPTRRIAYPLPLGDWDQHRRFRTASRDNLWAFAHTSIQQFTESGLGVLHGPSTHHESPMTGLLTGLVEQRALRNPTAKSRPGMLDNEKVGADGTAILLAR